MSERAEAYHAAASGETGSCSIEQEPSGTGVWKRLEAWRFGPLTLFATHGSGMTIRRTARNARFDSMNTVSIITQSQGRGAFTWNGHQQHVGPDTLALAQKSAGYAYGWSGTGLSLAFMVDADRLDLPEHLVRAAIPFLRHSRISALLLQHIRALHRDADQLSTGPAGDHLAAATMELTRALIASVSAHGPVRRAVAEDTLLVRILAYVRAHLTDPGLTPHRIASVHNISLRTLYRLCEEGEVSLEQWIIRQRLDGSRRALTSPEHAHRTIGAIARSWGFSSPVFFSRRFRQAYGLSPVEWRRHHR
ncbi:helix-turn-helix domain-containing protein [Micromonospora rosaria]|uniref:helix-turn-helix domain-containing protein n=1 Tax=Micromonospora rosaria TaxID=47874 RepID=UPI001B804488|nr:helix-turn-helix domain-containing protein [Micromonospora rosaria]